MAAIQFKLAYTRFQRLNSTSVLSAFVSNRLVSEKRRLVPMLSQNHQQLIMDSRIRKLNIRSTHEPMFTATVLSEGTADCKSGMFFLFCTRRIITGIGSQMQYANKFVLLRVKDEYPIATLICPDVRLVRGDRIESFHVFTNENIQKEMRDAVQTSLSSFYVGSSLIGNFKIVGKFNAISTITQLLMEGDILTRQGLYAEDNYYNNDGVMYYYDGEIEDKSINKEREEATKEFRHIKKVRTIIVKRKRKE